MSFFGISSKRGKQVMVHMQIWIFLFVINLIVAKNFRIDFKIWYHVFSWMLYLAVFYINYLVLLPQLFFHKKFTLYILSAIFLIFAGTFVRHEIEFSHFRKMIMDEGRNERISGDKNLKDMNVTPLPGDDGFKYKPLPEMKEIFQNRPKKRLPIMSFSGILLIFTGSISIRFIEKWQEDEKRKAQIEKENIATELSFLKQQINPHFLFNSLNSIYSLALTKSDKTVDSILKLSSLLRYMLYEAGPTPVKLSMELEIISDYIELQRLRLTEKVKLTYKVEGNAASYKIEPFILIPLIENVFKHGIDTAHASKIEISINITKFGVQLFTRNPIIKRPKPVETESGIGIKNITRRLDLLYPEKYNFDIQTLDNFFVVKLELEHIQ